MDREIASSDSSNTDVLTLEGIPDGLVTFDGQWRYTFVNAAAERLLGRSRSELLGNVVWTVFPYIVGTEIEERLRRVARDGSHVVAEVLDATGEKWLENKLYPTRDGGVAIFFNDVTSRKVAELALTREQELLHKIFDTIPVMITMYEPSTSLLRLNREFERITGWSTSEASGVSLMEECYPDPVHREEIREFMESCREGWMDIRMTTRDGRQIETSWANIRLSDNTRVGIGIDITHRTEAESALRESEERFAKFMRHLPGLAWIKDLDGHYIFANDAAVRAFQTTRERLYGSTDFDLFGSDVASQFRFNDRRAIESEWGIQTIETLEHDDGVHYSIVSKFPIPGSDGTPVLIGGMAIDITEGRETEEALRRQTERLRLLWESASVLLTTDEPNVMMRRLFAKIAEHFGVDTYFNYMVDDGGSHLRLASCVGVPEEALPAITRLEFGQAICGTVAQRNAPIVATFIQDSSDPTAQLARSFGIRSYACNPLIADGRLLGTLSFASHTRDQFDDEELEFFRTITNYVTVAYERIRLVRQLREDDRRKDEFLATLAHELRNPLAPLRNGIELLQMVGGEDADMIEVRAMMERQLAQMVHLIDDLLDVSRISRDRVELRRQRLELDAVLRSAVETSRPLVERAGHELAIDWHPEPIIIDGDVTRLAQVFANLLNNAAKYTERGGRIAMSVSRRDGEVVVSIRDNGVGIPREMLARIFEMFTQVDRSLERKHGGLGIGLTIVKRLVEMHGGRVEARSEGSGRGSEFLVHLPLASILEKKNSDDDGRIASHANAEPWRILVVDDNRDSAVSLAMLLRRMGNHAETAHDGAEALRMAERYRPGLILLDIGMPGMNGYDVARAIRNRPWGGGMKLVALTGWGQEEDRRRSREAGFDHHLLKPVEPSDLETLLASIGRGRA
jgi:PAS domain S-box-containing protein